MKAKKRYVCEECGTISQSWIGKCPQCGSWNSFMEELIEKRPAGKKEKKESSLLRVDQITVNEDYLVETSDELVNRFFGEGIVNASVILLAGDPGVGKSTFLLYLSNLIDEKNKIFYFSGEESQGQIKKRYERLGGKTDHLYLSNESTVETIIEKCRELSPEFVFIDSIQTMTSGEVESGPGSVSQIRECTSKLTDYSKESGTVMFIVGHITKTGEIAGPKVMEHMVDVVLYFGSDLQPEYRILRSIKNRYGSVNELLLFEMTEEGLKLIKSPSEFFISHEDEEYIGKCKSVIIEGRRPLLIEVEALVVPSVYSNPRIFSEGVDASRISRVAAILNKYLNENLNNYDIYFNISGGLKTRDVAMDLAIAAAIYSSKKRIDLGRERAFVGELSLNGTVRRVGQIERRVTEAEKFGVKTLYLAGYPGELKTGLTLREHRRVKGVMENL